RDWIDLRTPIEPDRGKDGPQNHSYAVRLGELNHAPEVILNCRQARRTPISRNVVGARQYVDGRGPQCDHIGIKAAEHLRARLTADAAIDAVSLKKVRPAFLPSLGDGIAHEYSPGR